MHATLKKALPLVLLCGFVGAGALFAESGVTPAEAQQIRENEISVHLGDLMNESMQVHHMKLWFAGHANNWQLATFEARKIEETIEELKEAIVSIQSKSTKWQRFPVGEMLNIFDKSLDGVKKAVKEKNSANFEAAYGKLTAACNACHIRAGESQIKIIVPTGKGPFANQDFGASGMQ